MKGRLWMSLAGAGLLIVLAAGAAWAAVQEPEARPWPRFALQGTVIAATGSEVSVETGQGEEAILLLGDQTRLWVPGQPPTTTITLAAGDPVLALGLPAGDEGDAPALEARLIVVAPADELPRYVVQGRVLATTAQTIVVQAQRGERAITILPRTRLWSPGGRLDSLRLVQPGERVLAVGEPTELGQWIAGWLLVAGRAPLGQAPGNGRGGEVTAVDLEAGTLTVETPRGELVVETDDLTRYRVPGVDGAGLDDVHVGDTVVLAGRLDQETGRWMARAIRVVRKEDSTGV